MSEPVVIEAQTPALAGGACWGTIGVRGDRSCARLETHVHCRNCPVFSAAAAQLLDRGLPGGRLAEWSALVAQVKTEERRGLESVVVFRVGAEWLGLPTVAFEEIAGLRPIHSLPHRGGAVLGLANVRGSLIVCLSLHQLLGVGTAGNAVAPQQEGGARLLVIGRRGSRVVCPVDEVHGVQRYDARDIGDAPATVARGSRHFTRAVLPWRERVVGLLDEVLLFEHINRSLALASAT